MLGADRPVYPERRRALRPAIATTLAMLALLVQARGALAATSISDIEVTRTGSSYLVAGHAVFDDQPFVALGSDPALDASPPGPLGLDLTEAAIRLKANGELEFRWTLTGLPPVLDGMDMTFLGWSFCVQGAQQSCFELEAGRFYHSQDEIMEQTAWSGQLWRCADPSCNWGQLGGMSTPVALSVHNVLGEAASVTATLPSADLGATPGANIVPVTVHPGGPVFAAVWQWHDELPYPGTYSEFGDGIDVSTPYTVPARSVSLAIGPPGQAPEEVDYQTAATVSQNGAFSGQLSSAGSGGLVQVYARACFGQANCGYATL